MKKSKSIIILFLSLLLIPLLMSQTKSFVIFREIEFPLERMAKIPKLNSKDQMFREYSYAVEDNYKNIVNKKPVDLFFFTYTVEDDSTLLEIASRCNITYDTIATINRMENITSSVKGKTLILPTAPGLFINKNQTDNALEVLLHEEYFDSITGGTTLYNIGKNQFFFLSDKKFSPTIRSYFLDATLSLPIERKKFWISSDFGRRKQPFTGEFQNHNGVDLAAPTGTPVHAIKDAVVKSTVKGNATFGNYIVLTHDNGKMTSLYAHLSKIDVEPGQRVKKGEVIGKVGQTGMATGPHLHFEIRQGGIALDPESKLRLK